MAQVGQVEQVEAGLQIYVEQVEQEQGGLQIPWNKWNKDKGSVQLNLSTWPNVELQGRERLFHFWKIFPTSWPMDSCNSSGIHQKWKVFERFAKQHQN